MAKMIGEALQQERESLRVELSTQINNAVTNSISSNHEDHKDDDAHPKGKSSTKRQKTSEHGTYSVGESPSEQARDNEPNPSGSGTQEQFDEFDAWIDDFEVDDDEVTTEEVSLEILEEISREQKGTFISTSSKESSSSVSKLSKRSKGSTNDSAESRSVLLEALLLRFAKERLCQIQNIVTFCLQIRLRFASRFCRVLLLDLLRFATRFVAFCFKICCVLLQDLLRFATRFVAFCFKTSCVLLQVKLRFASRQLALCLKIDLRFVYF
nr:hypothetical protein [Tanacetum cinerariifolium]